MKMKGMSTVFCAMAVFGTATVAMAGAYGEPEMAEEMPRSVEVVEEVVEIDEFIPFAYGAIGGVFSQEFFGGDAHQINSAAGWGLNARVGFRFIPNLAVELLYENVIEFDADSGSGLNNLTNIDRSAWTLMPNMKIFIVEGFCEPYVSIGGGLIYADSGNENALVRKNPNNPPPALAHSGVDDGAAFAARFGFGADFYATENIFIETEIAYVLPTGAARNFDHLNLSVGIGYAFN